MKRGEVWWARGDKRRPVVLVSRDEAYDVRALVIVAPVSTTVRGFSLEVRVGKAEGLPRAAVVNGDWLVTIPKADLISRASSRRASSRGSMQRCGSRSRSIAETHGGSASWCSRQTRRA